MLSLSRLIDKLISYRPSLTQGGQGDLDRVDWTVRDNQRGILGSQHHITQFSGLVMLDNQVNQSINL
jgi:hypothetical protein